MAFNFLELSQIGEYIDPPIRPSSQQSTSMIEANTGLRGQHILFANLYGHYSPKPRREGGEKAMVGNIQL